MSTSSETENPSDKPPESESLPADTAGETAEKEPDDDLPQREPLTPEDVEDEALRGDFMMRWATILLALLMGWTGIGETETLVHTKSGDYTLENGMPARTGVFSSTAEDKSWANLSWLFDVVLSVVYSAGGAILGLLGRSPDEAFTVFKALLAGVTFWFIVNTNRRDTSTWWGTVCAGLLLLVSYRLFTARPEIVTLLGIAVTLWMLHRWRDNPQAKFPRGLVILFLLWANLDPGMFYGLAVLVFYALGETLGAWLGFSGLENDSRRKQLWLTVGACIAATMINPFGWDTLLAPIARYSVEYPEWQLYMAGIRDFSQLQYFGVSHDKFWELLGAEEVAGLILVATALVTFVLNYRRLDFGHVVLWLGFVLLAVVASHELAAAALVSAVLATLNAQQWYQNTFRQSYSVETSELVFSRGGRVVTVLALFGIALLAATGRLDRRLGVGFTPNLRESIDGLSDELGLREGQGGSYDDRPFNFLLAQGDVLVWLDQKAFVDSRIGMYAGSGDGDILSIHRRTRKALRAAHELGPEGRKWKTVLDRYEITHVLPRLETRLGGSSSPDYRTFYSLRDSRDWQLTQFGATTAVFYRTDLPQLKDWLEQHRFVFVVVAFREQRVQLEPRAEWTRGPSIYEGWLTKRRIFVPNQIEEAQHYLYFALLVEKPNRFPIQAAAYYAALTHLAIRKANEGLLREPQSTAGYLALGRAYHVLSVVEPLVINSTRATDPDQSDRRHKEYDDLISLVRERRYKQAVGALQQALVTDDDDLTPAILRVLVQLQSYDEQRFHAGKPDLAVATCQQWIELHDQRGDSSKQAAKRREAIVKLRDVNQDRLKDFLTVIKPHQERLAASTTNKDQIRIDIVNVATRRGFTQTAMDVLDADPDFVKRNPGMGLMRVHLLQQMGLVQEASESLEQMSSLASAPPPPDRPPNWRNLDAFAALSRANYAAADIWQSIGNQAEQRRIDAILQSGPLAFREPGELTRRFANQFPAWGPDQLLGLDSALNYAPNRVADSLLAAALTHLESGDPESAAKVLRQIGEIAPDAPVRGLVNFYLQLTTGKALPPISPAPTKTPNRKKPVEAVKPK